MAGAEAASVPPSIRGLTTAAGVAAAAGLVTTLALCASPRAAAVALVVELALAAPAVWLLWSGTEERGWIPALAFGPFMGLGAGSIILLAFWAAGLRTAWMLAGVSVVLLLLTPLARRVRDRWSLFAEAPGDAAALFVVLLIVPIVVAAPFAHVGLEMRDGEAYRAYFTADYVWRRAVVAELAKGDMLPHNPFYVGDALHYYWLPHLASAVGYRALQYADINGLLLAQSVVVNAFFLAFLYGLARLAVPTPAAAAAGVIGVVLCSSYEGVYALADLFIHDRPLSLVQFMNIDAMTRWSVEGMPIDGLQRVLFYQPHHAEGYALGFLGLLAVARRRRDDDTAAMAVAGTLLALGVLVSSFSGMMFTAAAAVYEGGSVLRRRDWWRGVRHATAAALPLALSVALVTLLQYVDRSGEVLRLGLNPTAVRHFWEATFLSFGPVLPMSLVGGIWAVLRRRDAAVPLVVLFAVSGVFYFFIDVQDHQQVYAGWRVGHLTFISMTAMTALFWEWLALRPRLVRTAVATLTACGLAAALPTALIDIYNTQDVTNLAAGPSFTWTLMLSRPELEALAWVRNHTPPGAVVQVDPIARGTQTWSYLPTFAERRMGVGLPISMVPLFKYEQASRRAAWIFETGDAKSAHELARRNGIEYLFVGLPEQTRHRSVLDRFDGAPDLLPRVFRNSEVSIYRVE